MPWASIQVPPVQFGNPAGAVSWSGRSATSTPQEPLRVIVFWYSVTYCVPASTIPAPTGAAPASPPGPAPGTLGLLLSCTLSCMKIVQPTAPGTAGVEPAGH